MANQTKHLYPGAFRCEFDRRLPKDVQASHLALFLFSLLLIMSTILLNSTTIITYWKSTRLKEKTTNFMIMALSVNDLAVGLSSNIMYLITVWKEYSSGTTQCYIYAFQFCTQAIMSGCSLVTLVVMSFERYAAICHPFYHRTKVTKKLLMKCLLLLWIQVVFFTIMAAQFFAVFFRVILSGIALYVLLLFFIYARIFHAYRKSSARVQQQICCQTSQQPRLDYRGRTNKKLAKSCLIVVLSFTSCYLPLVLVEFVDKCVVDIRPKPVFVLTYWSMALILLNSSVNSIVFFWRNKVLREEAIAIIKTFTIYFKWLSAIPIR